MRIDLIAERKPYAAVAIVKQTNGLLLVGKHKTHDFRNGFWGFPGGGIDPGENALKAAARECFEETGIRCAPVKILQRGTTDRQVNAGIVFVECMYEGGDIVLSHEFSEIKWVFPEEFRKMDYVPENDEIIKKYI